MADPYGTYHQVNRVSQKESPMFMMLSILTFLSLITFVLRYGNHVVRRDPTAAAEDHGRMKGRDEGRSHERRDTVITKTTLDYCTAGCIIS
mmetsp:Transcript_18461/g.20859  ORF Transcript_18461/g.20859 Transcript_18461/m.20859 type:complete len:91 (-) Transcript_18461:48-320(-)